MYPTMYGNVHSEFNTLLVSRELELTFLSSTLQWIVKYEEHFAIRYIALLA